MQLKKKKTCSTKFLRVLVTAADFHRTELEEHITRNIDRRRRLGDSGNEANGDGIPSRIGEWTVAGNAAHPEYSLLTVFAAYSRGFVVRLE